MLNQRDFIGRTKEIELLKNTIDSERSTIAVVYGRRRIGKSSLIRETLGKTKYLSFEGIENASQQEQINVFMFQLYQALDIKLQTKKVKSWREAFLFLYNEIKDRPCHLVFDELQWMANYRKDLVSDLKMVWDMYFSKLSNITLILCGSIASFMLRKVINSSALYGRVDLQIKLKAFTLSETVKMLPKKGFLEQLDAHLYTGGVPKYLEFLQDSNSNIITMNQLAFTESGYLNNEFNRIFISHFGKNKNFKKIVNILAENSYGLLRADIVRIANLESGGLNTEHLNDLESAGFISSSVPFDKKENSRLKKFFLSDAYLRFYFLFIEPMQKKINSELSKDIFTRISQSPAYYNWRGRSFEYLCLQHADIIAKILGFYGIEFNCGPFFKSNKNTHAGVQIDLIFDRKDNVLTVCEMKYSESSIGVNVIEEVEKKCDILRSIYPKKTIQKVLITVGKASKELINRSYFYKIIMAEELIEK